MKLHSPPFEKALKSGVKAKIKSSPELKREYRNAKKAYRRRAYPFWIIRPVYSYIFFIAVWAVLKGARDPVSGLAMINLLTFASVSIYTNSLLTALFRANDLPALAVMPVPEPT